MIVLIDWRATGQTMDVERIATIQAESATCRTSSPISACSDPEPSERVAQIRETDVAEALAAALGTKETAFLQEVTTALETLARALPPRA
ncbi:hypothetical protein ACFT38_45850 [Streptomyces sp. NPDC056975]|uniref:hypothetical protein n=1 Tax=Streptomyces sp. NPDC056975 TaxID=3345985 RepID=UPI0036397A29